MTLVTTWVLVAVLVLGSRWLTRRLSVEPGASRWQGFLEFTVVLIRDQIAELGLSPPRRYIPFVGSLFLFIALANTASVIPGFEPPTGSLSTTAALATCVFVAVPYFGIRSRGWRGYLKTYLQPTFLMLPFNIIGEFSRTLALAVRLFGNILSGAMIAGIIVALVPLFFPILFKALELLTGLVQAYIFSVLAIVYIAAAHPDGEESPAAAPPMKT